MNKRKDKRIFNFILIVFLIISSAFLFNNKTIEKEKTKNNLKALDQEGQNYRLVTSADNVQVPVPKGYVASQVTGENYVSPEYQHTTINHKVSNTQTSLRWSSPAGEQYPWTQDRNGIWISGNKGIPDSTSTLESEEFDYVKGTTLTINYSYSCQYRDFLNVDLINVNNNTIQRVIKMKDGNTHTSFDYTTSNYTYTMNDWATGRYKIRATYSKDYTGDGGQDSAYIKTATYYKESVIGIKTIEEDIKTKIHDGGFVIYQLTDEELETDPNGTSIIINDANKDTAQRTRNQYVWVPVENIEDIVRTKTINNGIMQFGQVYKFSDTSIIKDTRDGIDTNREPKLEERSDRTKYYLQKKLIIDKRENYLNKMQEDYTKMLKSINKYKGFYIGRYETGDVISHSSSTECLKKPRIVKYNENINYITWYDSYKALERISGKTGKFVETGMIYDSLYDYTLKWLNETDTRSYKEIRSDSGIWGNYGNNSLKYKISANGTEITKNENSWIIIPSGGITEIIYKGEIYSDSPTSSNNIFDVAGNLYEWTRSRYSSNYRGARGGNYARDSFFIQAYDIINFNPYKSEINVGTRGELLIK